MIRTRAMLVTVVALALVAATAPGVAVAAEEREPIDPQIIQLLEEIPGGVLIDGDHVVWPELDMTYWTGASASGVAARAVGGCATARICAYSGYNLSGGVLSWSSCGNISIPSTFATRSVANARTSGYLRVRQGATVLVTVSANGSANVYGSANNILCYI